MSEEQITPKKRSRPVDDEAELEIDVTADEPLSKRAARRLKKGRSLKQAPSSQKPLPKEFNDAEEEDGSDDAQSADGESVDAKSDEENDSEASTKPDKKVKKTKKSESSRKKQKTDASTVTDEYKKGTNGIWIGNLSFRTSETDLTTFFTTLKPLGKFKKASDFAPISATDVVRISLPQSSDKKGQNKGFAYVDFKTPEQQETAIALSERILQGRNVLIKSADSFDGRPTKSAADKEEESKKETKILYVGNLSFDITDEDLKAFLGGDKAGIKKVRMATFEDSGKCKGFAFVDFEEVEGVRKILKDKKMGSMNGRKLKMEFGEDRSLRRKPPTGVSGGGGGGGPGRMGGRRDEEGGKVDPRTIRPGQALMNAQRASHAIVPAQGKKQSFA